MNVQVHHVIVHTPEQVAEIIAQARVIAEQTSEDESAWLAVFHEACTLLGARHSIALMPQQPSFDLAALGVNGRL